MHITIEILYFALLQEKSQKTQETLHFSKKVTPRIVYEELHKKYDFPLTSSQLRFAVNHRFADPDCLLQDGDKVAFIPPVSGG